MLAAAGGTAVFWPPARSYPEGRLDNNVGFVCSRGLLVHPDLAKAASRWQAAAERGSAAGQLNYALVRQNGLGVRVDEAEAAV